MDIFEELSKDIKKKKEGYNRNSIPSHYNAESDYKNRYKNRVLLEIIQNAEDAGASSVEFKIDKTANKISIYNNGEPFSLKGYQSLLYPKISSKPKGVYIGQKGLGFRALLNWAEEISIISNGIKVTFSRDISEKLLQELKNKDKDLEKIDVMEFLSVPKIEKIKDFNKGVTIEIIYNKNIDFENQFKEIDKECFLFLNNLTSINMPIGKIENIPTENLIIEEVENALPYELYKKEELKNKDERKIYYNIKLVWNPEQFYEDYPLYCYFKTNVYIGSPILIHAGFDLSDDRNGIDSNERNKFLVKEICNAIKNLVNKITDKYKNFEAYNTLKHYIRCEKNSIFEEIQDCFDYCLDNMEIYPCIDGVLRSKNNILVLPDELTEYIINLRTEYGKENFAFLDRVVKPRKGINFDLPQSIEKYYDIFNFISEKILSFGNIQDRVNLIMLYYKMANNVCRPSIFIDNNNEIISADEKVFYTESENIDTSFIPAFCKYRMINSELSNKLLNGKLLTIQQIKECITNFCPANVTNIFSILVDWLSKDISEENKKQIYSGLYRLYKDYETRINITDNIPVLCDDGNVYDKNVVFNFGYNVNDEILSLINDFIDKNTSIHRIVSKEYWEFLNIDNEELVNFLEFLKVSKNIDYKICSQQSDLFLNMIEKENIIILALLDDTFLNDLKFDNTLINAIKSRQLFSDYVIDTKRIDFINNGLLNLSKITNVSNDKSKINSILKLFGAQDTIDTISNERFEIIIKNLPEWNKDGDCAGRIYDKAFNKKVKIKGNVSYYSKDRGIYMPNRELYYYDNKCLPASKLKEFPTIDLGRRKGHKEVANCFNIKSIEDYTVQIIDKDIDTNLSKLFMEDFKRFYPLILAYRYSCSRNLSDEMKKEAAKNLKCIDVKVCKNLSYRLNDSFNKEELNDLDFINSDGVFYLKVNDSCKSLEGIIKHKKELYDFISEMLLMTFKLTEDGSSFKDIAANMYVFIRDLNFLNKRFCEDNNREVLWEAENYLDVINYKEEFWKHIHKLKCINEDYISWEMKNETKQRFSTADYAAYSEDMEAIFEEDDVNITPKEFFDTYTVKINFAQYNTEKFKQIYNSIKQNLELYEWNKCKKDKRSKYLERIDKLQWDNGMNSLFYGYDNFIPPENFTKELWTKLKSKGYDKENIEKIFADITINPQDIYNKNQNLFNDDELEKIHSSSKLESLLYFDDVYELIKEELHNSKSKPEIPYKQSTPNEWKDTTFERKSDYVLSPNLSVLSYGKTSFSSVEREINKIEQGKKTEDEALKILRESFKYTDVKDVRNLARGYDFECIEKATGLLIYIEVKSFEQNSFKMTENEYNIWKNNKNNYKILLLNANTGEKEMIDGENLENRFDIDVSEYKCRLK